MSIPPLHEIGFWFIGEGLCFYEIQKLSELSLAPKKKLGF
jgi:hypothetical protein